MNAECCEVPAHQHCKTLARHRSQHLCLPLAWTVVRSQTCCPSVRLLHSASSCPCTSAGYTVSGNTLLTVCDVHGVLYTQAHQRLQVKCTSLRAGLGPSSASRRASTCRTAPPPRLRPPAVQRTAARLRPAALTEHRLFTGRPPHLDTFQRSVPQRAARASLRLEQGRRQWCGAMPAAGTRCPAPAAGPRRPAPTARSTSRCRCQPQKRHPARSSPGP